jgi:hypothetical protein
VKDLIYTCVFGNYDWVFPPIRPRPGLHHVIVTDSEGPAPSGWERIVVNPSEYGGPVAANRYWKILGYLKIPGFIRTLYIDSNIRLLGDSGTFLDTALPPGVVMGIFRHPLRESVAAEMAACHGQGKIVDLEKMNSEKIFYSMMGFNDDVGLSENTIIARRADSSSLELAMRNWWELYQRFGSRDQFSLPVVRWRHNLAVHWIEWSFRDANPWFAIYAHRRGSGINPRFAWLEARAHDSRIHAAALAAWRTFRTVRRTLRSSEPIERST